MTLYLDTSALVKLYVEEDESEEVREACSIAAVIPTSHLAYTEGRAAFSRALHEKRLRRPQYQVILAAFHKDWDNYFVLEITKNIIWSAGELTETFPLRAFDAIHLASALSVQDNIQESLHFLCFDQRLNKAAKAMGLITNESR